MEKKMKPELIKSIYSLINALRLIIMSAHESNKHSHRCARNNTKSNETTTMYVRSICSVHQLEKRINYINNLL